MLKDSKCWNDIREILSLIQSIAVIFGVAFAIWQIYLVHEQVKIQTKIQSDNKKIASANYLLELSKRLDAPKYDKIMREIGYNKKNYPILKKSGGLFRPEEVDTLLGFYDTIGSLYREKLIEKEMAYNEFSEDFEAAWCNKSIQRYIEKIRKEDNVPDASKSYFFEFETLAKDFLTIEHRTCDDLD
jgi:hypothetical protein